VAQSFWEGVQSGLGPGVQVGAQAATEAQRARREQLKTVANLFVSALQHPGPDGERLFTGVLAVLGVPPDQWQEHIETLRGLDETKRVALESMASGKDIERTMPHILRFFGSEGLKLAQSSRQMQSEQRLRDILVGEQLLGPEQAPGPSRSPGLMDQYRSDARFGPIVGGVRAGVETGAISPTAGLETMLQIEKARGQDPSALLAALQGIPGVPTVTLDSTGKVAVNIDPTRRQPEDMPLGVPALGNLRVPVRDAQGNIVGYQTLPPGTSARQAREAGAEVIQKPSEMQGAKAMVESLEQMTTELFKGKPGLLNRIKEAGKRGQEYLTQEVPEVAIYQDGVAGMLSIIVRALGEKGTLTNQDIARVRKMFPQFFPLPDTGEVARQKISRLKRIVSEIERGNIDGARRIAGIGPAGSERSGGAIGSGAPNRAATHRYNPQTGKIEPVR